MMVDEVDLPVARAVIAKIGAEDGMDLLRRCMDTDLTDEAVQSRFSSIGGWRLEILDRDGTSVLTCIMEIGTQCYWEDGAITMPQRNLPHTIANSIAGRPVTEVTGDHPLFRDLTIEQVISDDAGTVIEILTAGRTLQYLESVYGK